MSASAHKLPRAITFTAWRVTASDTAIPLDIGAPDTWDDAKAEAMLGSCLLHKETLLIHARNTANRKGDLVAYAVKQKSRPDYRRCPDTGLSKPHHQLYLEEQFSLPIYDFAPERPFDAFRDDPTGIDRTMIGAAQ